MSDTPPEPSPFEPPSPSSQPPPPGPPPAPTPHAAPGQPPPPVAYPAATYPASQPPPPGPPPPPYASAPGHLPPPAYAPYPPTGPATKSSSFKTIMVIVGIVVVLLAVAIGGCTVWFVSTVKAPIDESNRFLAAINQRDYPAAVAMTNESCNNGLTVAQLEDLFRGQPIRYDLYNSNVTDGNSATVGGSLEVGTESSGFVTLRLRKFGDDWQVCTVRR